MGKSNFNWIMTDTQKEIIEYLMWKDYDGRISKSAYLWGLVYEKAMDSLGLPVELNISDESILNELRKEENIQKDMVRKSIIAEIGEEKYNQLLSEEVSKRGEK